MKRFGFGRTTETAHRNQDVWDPDAGTRGIPSAKSLVLIAARQIASDLGVGWEKFQQDTYKTNPDEFLVRATGHTDSGIPSFVFTVGYKVESVRKTGAGQGIERFYIGRSTVPI